MRRNTPDQWIWSGHSDHPEPEGGHPRSLDVREAAVTPGIDEWLAQLFDDERIEHTCQTLAGVSEPDPEIVERETQIRSGSAACDRRIARYHQLLDHDVDPALAAAWITEAQRESSKRNSPTAPRRASHRSQIGAPGPRAAGHRRCSRPCRCDRQGSSLSGSRRHAAVRPQRNRDRSGSTPWVSHVCRRGTRTLTPPIPTAGRFSVAV